MSDSSACELTPAPVRRFRFLPSDVWMAQWGISVTGAGLTDIPPHNSFSLRGLPDLYQFTWARGRTLPEYAFLYVARGGGVFESTPTGAKNVAAGDAIVFFPGIWHRYRPAPRSGWKLYWVNGNGRQLHALVQRGVFSPQSPLLHLGPDRELADAYQRILDLVGHDAIDNPLLLSAAMLEIVARFSSPSRRASAGDGDLGDSLAGRDPVVARAVGFIWNTPQRELTVESVVASSSLARRSLERRFQNALGHTIYEEILRCRIERAKRVLQDTAAPVKQVALMAGFPNMDRMGKVFQRLVGLSPMAYRRSLRHP